MGPNTHHRRAAELAGGKHDARCTSIRDCWPLLLDDNGALCEPAYTAAEVNPFMSYYTIPQYSSQ